MRPRLFLPVVIASECHERHLVNILLQFPVRDSKGANLFGQQILQFNLFSRSASDE